MQKKHLKKVIVSNKIIETKNTFDIDGILLSKKNISSLDAQKLFFIAISKIANAKKEDKAKIYENPIFIPIKSLAELTGINKNGLYTRIKDASRVLLGSFIESYEDMEGDEKYFNMISLVSSCKYTSINGAKGVLIKLNRDLQDEFIIERDFTQLSLESIVLLSSKYSIKLYSLLKYQHDYSQVSKKEIIIELEKLKFLLDSHKNDSYKKVGLFKNKVLIPSIKEINSKTELSVTFDTVKVGKKITSIKFDVKCQVNQSKNIYDDAMKDILTSSKVEKTDEYTKKLSIMGCDKKFINHILKSFEIDFVEYLIKKVEERNPENKGAYLNFLSSEPSIKNEFEVNRADEIELKNKKEREVKKFSNDEIMEEIERNRNKLLSKMRV